MSSVNFDLLKKEQTLISMMKSVEGKIEIIQSKDRIMFRDRNKLESLTGDLAATKAALAKTRSEILAAKSSGGPATKVLDMVGVFDDEIEEGEKLKSTYKTTGVDGRKRLAEITNVDQDPKKHKATKSDDRSWKPVIDLVSEEEVESEEEESPIKRTAAKTKGLKPSQSKISKTKASKDDKETEHVESFIYNHDKTMTLNIVSSKGKPRSIVLDAETVERLEYSPTKTFTTNAKGYLRYGGKDAHVAVMKSNNKNYDAQVLEAKRLWRLTDPDCQKFWKNGGELKICHINSDVMDPSISNLELAPHKVNMSMQKSEPILRPSGKYNGSSSFNGVVKNIKTGENKHQVTVTFDGLKIAQVHDAVEEFRLGDEIKSHWCNLLLTGSMHETNKMDEYRQYYQTFETIINYYKMNGVPGEPRGGRVATEVGKGEYSSFLSLEAAESVYGKDYPLLEDIRVAITDTPMDENGGHTIVRYLGEGDAEIWLIVDTLYFEKRMKNRVATIYQIEGYIAYTLKFGGVRLHRDVVEETSVKILVDHLNHIRCDDRRVNLLKCDSEWNNRNTSGRKGWYEAYPNLFPVQVQFLGKVRSFSTRTAVDAEKIATFLRTNAYIFQKALVKGGLTKEDNNDIRIYLMNRLEEAGLKNLLTKN